LKHKSKSLQISCDGGAATGKSTGAKMIAKKYKLKFLSSGLLYRYASYLILKFKPKNKLKFLKEKFKKLDYKKLEKINLYKGTKELEILSCWINDMKEGEYNPPHTHHDNTGWSSVMFLKVPEFINDVKDPHKFKDGQLGFTDVDGVHTTWMEPEVGHFYIFEAKHQHCVMPFKTKIKGEIRRSMSFNFIQKIHDNN